MNEALILPLVKDALGGIKHTARDTYLLAIIKGVIKELEDEQRLALDDADPQHLIFVVDYVSWRYEHPGDTMPRHLQFRLHNLIIHNGSAVV